MCSSNKESFHYSVNKEYDSVLQATVEVYNTTTDVEWVQVYKGISRGLNNLATNLTACVKDGDHTIEAFRESFKAFEDREIFKGELGSDTQLRCMC